MSEIIDIGLAYRPIKTNQLLRNCSIDLQDGGCKPKAVFFTPFRLGLVTLSHGTVRNPSSYNMAGCGPLGNALPEQAIW